MIPHWLVLTGVPLLAGSMSLALMPLVIAGARRFGVLDLPHARSVHANPTPRIGGVAITLGTVAACVAGLLTLRFVPNVELEPELVRQLAAAAAAVALVFVVGLMDDIRTVSARFKMVSLLAAAVAIAGVGLRFDQVILGGGRAPFELHVAAWPITLLWIVGLATALNFIDGLDGLLGGLGVLASATIAAVLLLEGHVAAALPALALLGGLCGFLVLNKHPAKVFMGDSGSLFVGVVLAVCVLLANSRVGTARGVLLPALALSIPIVDAALTLFRRRFIQRQSIFAAERGHVHHLLLDMGLTQTQAVRAVYLASFAALLIGVAALTAPGWATLAVLALVVPLIYGFFRFAGSVRTRSLVQAVRRKGFIDRTYRRYDSVLQDHQLQLRAALDFPSWWQGLCHAARDLELLSLDLPLIDRDQATRTLRWRPENATPDSDDDGIAKLSASVPIRDRRGSETLIAHVALAATHSLELAGHRLSLFARLLAENGVAHLPNNCQPQRHDEWHHVRRHAATISAMLPLDRAAHPVTPTFPSSYGTPHPSAATILTGPHWPAHGFTRPRRPDPSAASPPIPIHHPDATPDPDQPLAHLRVAVVHDFLYVYAGAERVLEQIIRVLPHCDLFALFDFLPQASRGFLQGKPVKTSFIQHLPFARSKHRAYLPLMPLAIEQLDLSQYDLVVSSSYLAAKGVITGPDQLHVCYCHSPARYAWDLQHQYLDRQGIGFGPKGMLARLVLQHIRNWDARSAQGVDRFIANSDFIARRIQKTYRRDAAVLYPPVDTDFFRPGSQHSDFYLTASRLVPYKRIDVIIEAFNKMPDKRLIVIGDGPDRAKLEKIAAPNVTLVGHQPADELLRYMQLAKAFIFAAEEDFGIVPVEAMACGTPVLAFGHGGVRETVQPGHTGLFFNQQMPESLTQTIHLFEQKGLTATPQEITAQAQRYATTRFRQNLQSLLEREWAAHVNPRAVSIAHASECNTPRPARRVPNIVYQDPEVSDVGSQVESLVTSAPTAAAPVAQRL